MGLFSSLTKPSWERAKRRAEKATKAGDPAAAYQHYGDALDGCPDDERDQLEKARNRAASDLHAAHMGAARELEATRRFQEAAERYDLALRFAVESVERKAAEQALRDLVSASLEREEADEVEAEAPEEEPVDPQAVFVMLLSDVPEERADEYEALGEEFRDAYLKAQQGHAEEALATYVALTAQHPESAVLHYEYGNALRSLERYSEAIEQLERAEELAEGWIDVKLALAESAWRLERWDLAEAVLQRAVDSVQDDPRVYAAVARTAYYTQTPDYGLEATEAGLELDPNHRELTIVRGQLLEMAERETDAIDLYEAQIEKHWRYDAETDRLVFDHEAGLLAARLYYRRRENLERSEELLRAVIHVTPARGRWQFEILLAEVIEAAGRSDEAQQLAHEAALAVPEDQVLWRLRAADLVGNADKVKRLVALLDDEQRELWEARRAERRAD